MSSVIKRCVPDVQAWRYTSWAKERPLIGVAPTDVVRHIVRPSAVYESRASERCPSQCTRQEIVVNDRDVGWATRMGSTWTVCLPDHRPELRAPALVVCSD